MSVPAGLSPRERRRLVQIADRCDTTPEQLVRDAVRVLIATFQPDARQPRAKTVRPSVRPYKRRASYVHGGRLT